MCALGEISILIGLHSSIIRLSSLFSLYPGVDFNDQVCDTLDELPNDSLKSSTRLISTKHGSDQTPCDI